MDSLIKLLSQNARLSTSELSVLLGKTEEEVKTAIKEYEEKGIIKGYTAILNEELIDKNYVTALIELKVSLKEGRGYDEIAKLVTSYSEVQSLSLMSGTYDLLVIVKADTLLEVASFVSQRLAIIDGVISTATHFELQKYKDKGIVICDEKCDERGFVCP